MVSNIDELRLRFENNCDVCMSVGYLGEAGTCTQAASERCSVAINPATARPVSVMAARQQPRSTGNEFSPYGGVPSPATVDIVNLTYSGGDWHGERQLCTMSSVSRYRAARESAPDDKTSIMETSTADVTQTGVLGELSMAEQFRSSDAQEWWVQNQMDPDPRKSLNGPATVSDFLSSKHSEIAATDCLRQHMTTRH
ncbi:hypothetical protein Bbelb_046050 [Branchiostoma belcheri]|nr:hypothetical protein Bbelb_046050 [Branchiostoma belcheri]